jgi:hypothetical protein
MVCFRNIIVNTQHKGDNNNNNNAVAAIKIPILGKHHSATILFPSCFQTLYHLLKQEFSASLQLYGGISLIKLHSFSTGCIVANTGCKNFTMMRLLMKSV